MATTQQQFCVRWNSYQSNLQNAFPKLLTSEHFVDVTLACESEMIKCHKVVLSACSTYFEKLLVQNPCQHPIIFMKDMRFAEMQALVDFMYKGEVNVTQDELPSLLRSAEALQIRGLCGSDQLLSQHNLSNLQGSGTQQQQQQQANNSNSNTSNTSATANGIHNTDKKDSQSTSTTNGGGTSEQLKKKTTTDGELVLENGRLDVVKREPIDVPDTVSIGNSNSTHSTTNSTYSSRGVGGGVCGGGGGGAGGDHEYNSELTPTHTAKDELYDNDESYYDNDGDLMDTEYLDQDLDEDPSQQPGTSSGHVGVAGGGTMIHNEKSPDFAIANVSCQYSSDGSPGGGIPGARRIRRSEAELRRAAECITRGQTFQTVSDQFNIPISTIRFYMARKGILPRRKRGRACSTPGSNMLPSSHNSSMSGGGGGGGSSSSGGFHGSAGNTSPVGPPYHIVHYKLPTLGAKLK